LSHEVEDIVLDKTPKMKMRESIEVLYDYAAALAQIGSCAAVTLLLVMLRQSGE